MPRLVQMVMGAVALGGLALTTPAVAAPPHPEAITVELRIQSVRLLATPPVVSNRGNNAMRQGIPLPQIVAGLQAMEPYRDMRYIGIERFDPRTGIYTLRFLDGRQIVVVQVDGRTGRILSRGF